MQVRRTSLTVTLIAALNLPAFGSYVSNYAGWRALSEGQKQGYVMGVYDGHHSLISDDDPYGEANSQGVSECAQQLKLNSGMLVQLVETNYARDPQSWGSPPFVVLTTGLLAMCKTYVNNQRRAKKLDLLK